MSDQLLATAAADNQQSHQQQKNNTSVVYTSISPHKLVTFTLLDDKEKTTSTAVSALFVEGEMALESQWQTPFENSNPEHKLPTLMAGLQSGQLMETLGSVAGGVLGNAAGSAVSAVTDPILGTLQKLADSAKGRTNLTKVNTEQIFLSTQSVRLTMTVFLIAIEDAVSEVEEIIQTLQAWCLPQELYAGTLVQGMSDSKLDNKLFPSSIPPFISLTLHGKTYTPFILESVSTPLGGAIDKNGNRLNATLSLNLVSKTAWDAKDISKLYGGSK
ncbi:hypothetical protein [Acinetobacter boissieri]|uniref:Uncharacterized protein n=1 Tax=Acinetobacter boissieri TaxID=1219383 RepID=A0A1G6GYL3_9GAMM|nr:hypothetical protein [Acinetobacter boissieri]SDB87051.1 hypothetical protein SAMN05421733_10333 [Acinetobacter boissieri]